MLSTAETMSPAKRPRMKRICVSSGPRRSGRIMATLSRSRARVAPSQCRHDAQHEPGQDQQDESAVEERGHRSGVGPAVALVAPLDRPAALQLALHRVELAAVLRLRERADMR